MSVKPLRKQERIELDRVNNGLKKAGYEEIGWKENKVGISTCSTCGCKFEYFLEKVHCPDCYDKIRANERHKRNYLGKRV